MPQVADMKQNDLNTMLHALNTFPKAFLVWGILDNAPKAPMEMEEKLKKQFPYLCRFPFLTRKNFNQYCHRSLKGVVIKDYTYREFNSFQMDLPIWQLIDDSIQPIAGFLLAKCIEIGVNSETFLASSKNSTSFSNMLGIRILERLYKNQNASVNDLALYLHLEGTSVDRHLLKLASNNFVAYEAPTSISRLRKRRVKNTIAEITQEGSVVCKEILRPITSVMNGQKKYKKIIRTTEPSKYDLIKAMGIYATKAKLNPS